LLTGIDELGLVANLQVVEDRGIIEKGQVGHVLTLLELGRVDLTNLGRGEDFFLQTLNYFVNTFLLLMENKILFVFLPTWVTETLLSVWHLLCER